MSKRAIWRRKVYRWRIHRQMTFRELAACMTSRSLKEICIETLTVYPWAMGDGSDTDPGWARFKQAKKEIKRRRKLGILADGSKRK